MKMLFKLKPRYISKEELIEGLRETVTKFNVFSGDHKFGLILFGSRMNGIPKIYSDVDLFLFHIEGPNREYGKSARELERKTDEFLLRYGIVNPFPYHHSFEREHLLLALENEDYRKELLRGILGVLDKYSLYIGPEEEENQSLIENTLELNLREPYSFPYSLIL